MLLSLTLANARAEWTFLLEASDGSAFIDLQTVKKKRGPGLGLVFTGNEATDALPHAQQQVVPFIQGAG